MAMENAFVTSLLLPRLGLGLPRETIGIAYMSITKFYAV